jgi:hypothetical protein
MEWWSSISSAYPLGISSGPVGDSSDRLGRVSGSFSSGESPRDVLEIVMMGLRPLEDGEVNSLLGTWFVETVSPDGP